LLLFNRPIFQRLLQIRPGRLKVLLMQAGRHSCHPTNHIKATATRCRWEAATICPRPLWPWPFDLESGVRISCDVGFVPILVFLGLFVLDLGPMYATDRRQTTDSIIA